MAALVHVWRSLTKDKEATRHLGVFSWLCMTGQFSLKSMALKTAELPTTWVTSFFFFLIDTSQVPRGKKQCKEMRIIQSSPVLGLSGVLASDSVLRFQVPSAFHQGPRGFPAHLLQASATTIAPNLAAPPLILISLHGMVRNSSSFRCVPTTLWAQILACSHLEPVKRWPWGRLHPFLNANVSPRINYHQRAVWPHTALEPQVLLRTQEREQAGTSSLLLLWDEVA